MTRKHRHRDGHAPRRETFAEEFFLQHLPHVRRRFVRMGFGEADVDDLVQHTFVVAHRRWSERPRTQSRYRNWLEAIAWRLGMNLRRRRLRRREIFEQDNFDAFESGDMDLESRVELRRIFDTTNDTLLPEDRRMLFDYYVEDMPLTELAIRHGLARSTAWTRLQQIRRQAAQETRNFHAWADESAGF